MHIRAHACTHAHTIHIQVALQLHVLERVFVGREGKMGCLRDQNLDAFSRADFPVAYLVMVGAMYMRLPLDNSAELNWCVGE